MLNRCPRLLCHNRPIWVWRCSLVTERCSQTPPPPPLIWLQLDCSTLIWLQRTLIQQYGPKTVKRCRTNTAPTLFIQQFFSAQEEYIYIYIFCFLIKKVMKDACLFHIKGTTSLIIFYPLRVPVHERCLTPAFASCRRRQWPEILQYRIFWTTFVVYHPNYYFSSQLGHVERKSVACKLKAATSWLHKKVL